MMASPGQACDLELLGPSSHQWHETPSDITASKTSLVVRDLPIAQAAMVTASRLGDSGNRQPVASWIATPKVLHTQKNSALAAVICLSVISDLESLSSSTLIQWRLPGLNWALAAKVAGMNCTTVPSPTIPKWELAPLPFHTS